MSATRSAVVFISLAFALLVFQGATAQSVTSPAQPSDVRVLIDISGSMKKNDPHNLRRPAVDLLVQLLPEDSHAGIWLFGDDAQLLVPHEPVSDLWRSLAAENANRIDSSDMFTDIGAALDAAAAAGPVQPGHRGSLILLTDGVVDVSKDDGANQREWQRIVDEVLPRLQAAGFTIHTIALSDHTDRDLLNKLSISTDGLSATARTADELMATFLKIFDAAAPAERVVLNGNQFTVDASIEEFTALVFRQPGSEPAQLQDPKGRTLNYADRGYHVGWHRGEHYDLVTVSEPVDGQWQIIADMAPDSRVTVVSNLRLRVRDLPTNVYKGQSLPVSFALQEDGRVLNQPEFLRLMTFDVELQYSTEGEPPELVWQNTLRVDEPPASGIFNSKLPKFGTSGEYRLTVRVDGKSFRREVSHVFAAHMPFEADISAEQRGGDYRYLLTLRSNSAAVDPNRTQVAATIINPQGRRKVRPMPLTELRNWQASIVPVDAGQYRVEVTVSGTEAGGYEFDYRLQDLEFYYSPERGMIRETPAGEVLLVEPEGQANDAAAPSEAAPQEPAMVEAVADPQEDEATSDEPASLAAEPAPMDLGRLALYSGIGLGHILLLGMGYWAYRRITSNEKDADSILGQFSEEEIAAGQAGRIASAEADDQAEPEMEGVVDVDEDSDKGDAEAAAFNDTTPDDNQIDAQEIEDILAEATSQGEDDSVDEASLNAALASIMGELDDEPDPAEDVDASDDGEDSDLAAADEADDRFGLSEQDEQDAEEFSSDDESADELNWEEESLGEADPDAEEDKH